MTITAPPFNRQMVLPAVLVALSYAALVVLAAVCAFGHGDPSSSHAHHGSPEASPHNALCAWTCQATSDAVVAMASPMATSGPVVRLVMLPPHQPASSSSSSVLHSRAPPSMPFARIG
ncbi:MAG: hypothetical protein HOP00_02470 [Nitrospira sp.]|nr:hypothetical protein [Nitrospira sp.]